jgi:carboxylesterase
VTTSPAAPPHPRPIDSLRSWLGRSTRRIRDRSGTEVGCAPVLPEAEQYQGGSGPLGVLLLHGFTGNPSSMRPWADQLERDGFRVSVPRLAGHGTTWQELNQTRWEDWYETVESAFDNLSAQCQRTFVCGLSMGGGLALLLAARRGSRVAGLALTNPSVHSPDPRRFGLPVLRHVLPSLAAIGGDIAQPDITESAYERTPLHAAWSVTELFRTIRQDLPRVDQPMIIYKSRVDHVLGDRSLEIIRQGVRSRDIAVVNLERSYHVATLDYDADLIFSGTSEFFTQLAAATK